MRDSLSERLRPALGAPSGRPENFIDLKSVRRNYRCSSALLQRVLYEQLELKRRMRQYPWPTKIGIDEHLFKHEPKLNQRRFVTMVVDKNKRLMEVVHGKSTEELRAALDHIPGRENVRWVALDMSDSYRSFARDFFPNARLVADKFHVLRLVTPAIHRALRALGLGREALPLYRVLRRNPFRLRSLHSLGEPRSPLAGQCSSNSPICPDLSSCRWRSTRLFQNGGSRARARRGGSVGSPMWRRKRTTFMGSVMRARRRIRPPQRGQVSTSMPKVRLRSSAQGL